MASYTQGEAVEQPNLPASPRPDVYAGGLQIVVASPANGTSEAAIDTLNERMATCMETTLARFETPVGAPDLRAALKLVCSEGRKVAAECQRMEEEDNTTLQCFRDKTIRARPLGMGKAPNEHHAPCPSTGIVHRTHWVPPLIDIAKTISTSAGIPQADSSAPTKYFHKHLRDSFMVKFNSFLHSKAPSLKGIKPSALTQSLCRPSGFCLCEMQDFKLFRVSFINMVSQLYKKRLDNKFKHVFESSRGVLLLEWIDLDADQNENEKIADNGWYHLSAVNQVTWKMSIMQLFLDTESENAQVATAVGNVALQTTVFLDDLLDPGNDPFHLWAMMTIAEAFGADKFDLACRCWVYTMAEGIREIPNFKPAEIEVTRTSTEPICFWPGAVAARKALRRIRKTVVAAPLAPSDGAPGPAHGGDNVFEAAAIQALEDDIGEGHRRTSDDPVDPTEGGCGGDDDGEDNSWVEALHAAMELTCGIVEEVTFF